MDNEELACALLLSSIYVHTVPKNDILLYTQRSYLDAKLQQVTATGIGTEPVKDMFKAQIIYVHIANHTSHTKKSYSQNIL